MSPPKAELRRLLLEHVDRWSWELSGDRPLRGTLELGMALNAVHQIEVLLRLALGELLPEAVIPEKATLGQLVDLIRRYGPKHRLDCLQRQGKLIARSDIAAFDRLTKARNSVAHPDAVDSRVSDVREVVAAVQATASLRMFDELQCRLDSSPDASTGAAERTAGRDQEET